MIERWPSYMEWMLFTENIHIKCLCVNHNVYDSHTQTGLTEEKGFLLVLFQFTFLLFAHNLLMQMTADEK